jgi:peptidoglycan hydrolase-like protein with peptidoglycan-binding domain
MALSVTEDQNMPLSSTHLSSSPRLQKAVKNAPPVSVGESNEGVAAMQQGLIDLGFDMPVSTNHGKKPPDGIYGSETGKVLKRFQQYDNVTSATTSSGLFLLRCSHSEKGH